MVSLPVSRKRSRGVWPIPICGNVKQYKITIFKIWIGFFFFLTFYSPENKSVGGSCCRQGWPVEMH